MASRLLRREVRLVRHRALVVKTAPNINEERNFISLLHQQILNNLKDSKIDNLYPIASYYFDGKGKSIRPHIVNIMSQALTGSNELDKDALKVGMIAEMIHTASLIHDDVIDKSDTRRGKEAANIKWGVCPAVMAGNYIIAASSQLLASFNNDEVTIIISRIIEDLIHGELCQMEAIQSTHKERYKQYLNKTYLKTASLIANSCEAIAILNDSDAVQVNAAREFGRNIGLAFQIQDDRLDFIADAEQLGKPACADLNLGLSTAPVLYASEEFEYEMIPMMSRRFSKEGDVQRAFDIIKNKSDALLRTRHLAEAHALKAESCIHLISSDPIYQNRLRDLTVMVTRRDK